jgi:hypothetical protein
MLRLYAIKLYCFNATIVHIVQKVINGFPYTYLKGLVKLVL